LVAVIGVVVLTCWLAFSCMCIWDSPRTFSFMVTISKNVKLLLWQRVT